eukprot:4446496-Amphidinium_carterae.1
MVAPMIASHGADLCSSQLSKFFAATSPAYSSFSDGDSKGHKRYTFEKTSRQELTLQEVLHIRNGLWITSHASAKLLGRASASTMAQASRYALGF